MYRCMKLLHPELSHTLENCFERVYKKLGYGFLEKLYEKALRLEFDGLKIKYSLKPKLDVFYNGLVIGQFYPDVVVEERIIVEIKSIEALKSVHVDHPQLPLRHPPRARISCKLRSTPRPDPKSICE